MEVHLAAWTWHIHDILHTGKCDRVWQSVTEPLEGVGGGRGNIYCIVCNFCSLVCSCYVTQTKLVPQCIQHPPHTFNALIPESWKLMLFSATNKHCNLHLCSTITTMSALSTQWPLLASRQPYGSIQPWGGYWQNMCFIRASAPNVPWVEAVNDVNCISKIIALHTNRVEMVAWW